MVLSSALDNPAGMKQEDIDQDAKKQVETVQLDSMVALKIIKHCRENQQDIVTGQLLGLDVDGCLEVTNCFPLPQANKDDETIDVTTYQLDMLRALRDVNIDHNVVGWYQSARNGSFISASFVETQADYQSKFGEKCVVLVHDVTSIERGNLAIRAFRLSKNFMKAIRNKNFTTENFRKLKLNSSNILVELPVKIRNSTLAEVLLDELDTIERPIGCDAKRLELTGDEPLNRSLSTLADNVDEWHHEQGQWLYWLRGAQRELARQQQAIQKRRQENKERAAAGLPLLPDEPDMETRIQPEPSRFDQLLISHQMTALAKQIESDSAANLKRLYTAKAVQQ